MPRHQKMTIFVLMTTTTQPITLPLAHARGIIIDSGIARAREERGSGGINSQLVCK